MRTFYTDIFYCYYTVKYMIVRFACILIRFVNVFTLCVIKTVSFWAQTLNQTLPVCMYVCMYMRISIYRYDGKLNSPSIARDSQRN